MDEAISAYMRAMQRKSAASRWAGKSPEQRSAEMRRLRAKARTTDSSKQSAAGHPKTGKTKAVLRR